MKPKLLIFINSLKLGGAERVVSHLLHHLNDDFELHLALYRKEIDYDIPPNIPVFDLQQSLDEQPYAVFLKIPWLSSTNLGLNYQIIHLDNQRLWLKVVTLYG
jgi:hypothetical protein